MEYNPNLAFSSTGAHSVYDVESDSAMFSDHIDCGGRGDATLGRRPAHRHLEAGVGAGCSGSSAKTRRHARGPGRTCRCLRRHPHGILRNIGRARQSCAEFPDAFNQIAIRRIDKNQAELIEKKDGATVALVLEKISQAGRELTMVTHQAGHPDEINVLRRSGGTKDAGNPFVGEWTQDLSETRLRQGLILKIEAVGKDEVHFSGDFRLHRQT